MISQDGWSGRGESTAQAAKTVVGAVGGPVALFFVSNYVNKVDQKGRVSVPAPFRQALGEELDRGVFVYRAFDRKVLEAATYRYLGELQEAVEHYPRYSPEANKLRSIFADMRQLPLDPEGRIMLPQKFMDYAEIKDAVAFVGRGSHFELWEPRIFEEDLEAVRAEIVQDGGPPSFPPRRKAEVA